MKHFVKWTAILFSANVVSTIIHIMTRETTGHPLWQDLLFDFVLAAVLAFVFMKIKVIFTPPKEA